MYDFDCAIKSDVYPRKIHSWSKNIGDISCFVINIRGISKEIYHKRYCMDIPVVER